MTTRRYVILGGIATALFESAVPAGQVFGALSGASDPTASNAGRKSLAAGSAQNVVLIPYGTGTSFTLNATNLPGYNGLLDKIECIGGGGAGLASMSASINCPGGGGGAYALSTAIEISLGTTVTIQIGAGGSASGAAGTDTWFGGATLATSLCGAKGGTGATHASGGVGGAASSCVFSGSGGIAYSGGNGGPVGGQGSSGGGGAGGPLGAGGAGGAGNTTTLAGGGGGGNGGGGAGGSSTSINGGAGGSHSGSTGGGAAGTPSAAATTGSDGGGGGGAASQGPGTGANGSEGNEWTLTAGGTAGSGGGGGGGVSGLTSGNGAVAGGGGAGGGVSNTGFGTGGAGFIVLTYTPTSDGSAFVPVSGFTLSAPGGYADGQSITITGPAGSFGTKPGGAKVAWLWRPGKGYAFGTDPLSRNSGFSDTFWPEEGATGPSSGSTPGLQQSTCAPGDTWAFQTIYPGAAVITATLTANSATLSNVVQVSGTNYLNIQYAFGGLPAIDLTTNYLEATTGPDAFVAAILATSQPNLSSAQIMLEPAGQYNSVPTVNATDVTVNLAWGPDQISWPRAVTSRTQDQWYSFRGMNTFGWRSADFNRQNMKFMRFMAGHGDLSLDIVFHNNAQETSNLIDSIVLEGGSLANVNQFVVTGGGWVYTANQWYTHHVMYHGNTSTETSDGGLVWLADGTVQQGSLGSSPSSQGLQFYGTANGGGTGHPSWFEANDIACRPQLPLQGDETYCSYTANEDSACHVCFVGANGSSEVYEIQWPTAWSDTSVTFVMNRDFLDGLFGTGSLSGLKMIVQTSNYSRTVCGTWTATA
jgi:hypothetical protein